MGKSVNVLENFNNAVQSYHTMSRDLILDTNTRFMLSTLYQAAMDERKALESQQLNQDQWDYVTLEVADLSALAHQHGVLDKSLVLQP
jgi:hypothetical protein